MVAVVGQAGSRGALLAVFCLVSMAAAPELKPIDEAGFRGPQVMVPIDSDIRSKS